MYKIIFEKYKFTLIYICLLNTLYGQQFLHNSFSSRLSILLNDSGVNWNSLSLFENKLYKKKTNNYNKTSFSIRSNSYFNLYNKSFNLISDTYLISENNLYTFLHISHGNNISNHKQIEERVEKEMYNKLKIRFSSFGYRKKWVSIELKKGAEGWGAGENIDLALSQNSKTYDYFDLNSDYGNLRVKYIHGFLEKYTDNNNRYLTARGVEWSNRKSILLGISETVIYSGKNRSLDAGYLNPVSSHLEIELNNRLNFLGDSSSNAVWQFHSDFIFKKKIRVSLNYLIDEFVLDPNIEIGKEHGRAYSMRFSYLLLNNKSELLSVYWKNIFVGTPTFRHGNGLNNFTQKRKPLGWIEGSDSEEISFGVNYSNKSSIICSIYSGKIFSGDESIKFRQYDPYQNYLEGSFPSGNINVKTFFNSYFEWWLKKGVKVYLISNLILEEENNHSLGISYEISKLDINI